MDSLPSGLFSGLTALTGLGTPKQDEEKKRAEAANEQADDASSFEQRRSQMDAMWDESSTTLDFFTRSASGLGRSRSEDSEDGLGYASLGLCPRASSKPHLGSNGESSFPQVPAAPPQPAAGPGYSAFRAALEQEKAAATRLQQAGVAPSFARGSANDAPAYYARGSAAAAPRQIPHEPDDLLRSYEMRGSRALPPVVVAPAPQHPNGSPTRPVARARPATFAALDTDMPTSGSEGNMSLMAPSSDSEALESQKSWVMKKEIESEGELDPDFEDSRAKVQFDKTPQKQKTSMAVPALASSLKKAINRSSGSKEKEKPVPPLLGEKKKKNYLTFEGIGEPSKKAKPLLKLTRPDGPPSWGALRFPGMGQRPPSKWCAFGVDTDASDIVPLLINTWGMTPPDVIISITGAAVGDIPDLSCAQKEIFKAGLLRAVAKTHAWVITGGTNGGVMGLVGRAMAEQPASESLGVCLGIATWGIVKNHEDIGLKVGKVHKYEERDPGFRPVLGSHGSQREAIRRQKETDKKKRKRLNPLTAILLIQCWWRMLILARDARKKVTARRSAARKGPRAPLDPHHSHFLFVDAGDDKAGQFGHEIAFRTQLEEQLCQGAANEYSHASSNAVMILLVVAGGPNTLRTVIDTLEMNRPVLVLAHSGMAARDIYEYMMHGCKLPVNTIKRDPKQPDGGRAFKDRQAYCDTAAPRDLPLIKKLGERVHGLYHHPLITFFGVEDLIMSCDGRPADEFQAQKGFDTFVLDAILSNVHLPAEALMHAVTWGDPELVQKQLEVLVRGDYKETTLSEALLEAIISYGREPTPGALECVRLLMEFGAEVKDIAFDDLFDPMYFKDTCTFLKNLAVRYDFRQNGGAGFLGADLLGGARHFVSGTVSQANDRFSSIAGASAERLPTSTVSILQKAEAMRNKSKRHVRRRMRDVRSHLQGAGSRLSSMNLTSHAKTAAKFLQGKNSPILEMSRLQSFSFFVLESLSDTSGYRGNIRARSSLGIEDIHWMDLMLWSVIAGHFGLSRVLWTKTQNPMRMALVARRICLKLKSVSPISSADELEREADNFENWALGIIDAADNEEDALHLLTCVPARKDPASKDERKSSGALSGLTKRLGGASKDKWIGLWQESALDEAAKYPIPCRKFLSHPHCQHVLKQYFAGNYRGSKAAIPGSSKMITIALNSVIHTLNLFLCGLLPELIKVSRPSFPALLKEEFDDEEFDEDEEIDDLDADYFGPGGDLMHEAVKLTRCFSITRWGLYFNIPKVKYTMHAVFNLACLVLLVTWICMSRSAPYDDYYTKHELLEVMFWTFYIGRVLEEYGQIRSQGIRAYWSNFWNIIDTLLFIANSAALGLRIITVYTISNMPYTSQQMRNGAVSSGNVTQQEFADIQRQLGLAMWTDYHGMDAQVIGFIFLAFRYIEMITYNRGLGETFVILVKMVADASQVILMMVIILIVVGVSMVASFKRDLALEPYIQEVSRAAAAFRSGSAPTVEIVELNDWGGWREPWSFGLWATLGEFGDTLEHIYERRFHRETTINSLGLATDDLYLDWLPFLLYISTFVMTIFLVNLMIAKMTSTYEKVQEQSLAYRAEQKVSLIAEFKDERGPPPPFNILTSLSMISVNSSDKGYYALMGKTASLRVHQRERVLLHKYETKDAWRESHSMEQQVSDVQDRQKSMEAMSKHATRMQAAFQRELIEIKENQTKLLSQMALLIGRHGSARL